MDTNTTELSWAEQRATWRTVNEKDLVPVRPAKEKVLVSFGVEFCVLSWRASKRLSYRRQLPAYAKTVLYVTKGIGFLCNNFKGQALTDLMWAYQNDWHEDSKNFRGQINSLVGMFGHTNNKEALSFALDYFYAECEGKNLNRQKRRGDISGIEWARREKMLNLCRTFRRIVSEEDECDPLRNWHRGEILPDLPDARYPTDDARRAMHDMLQLRAAIKEVVETMDMKHLAKA